MRVPILDLLRFGAALGVVFYHLTARSEKPDFPNLALITQYGYLGVPLFFMISGFVIAASAEGRTAIDFLISRASRLYPAYWIGVSLAAICPLIFYKSTVNFIDYLANLTMLNDYIGIENLDGVYWTLQAELKFYACVFILLITNSYRFKKTWLTCWLFLTTAFTFTQQPFFFPWLINPSYSPYFILGICFYQIMLGNQRHYFLGVAMFASLLALRQAYLICNGFILYKSNSAPMIAATIVCIFILLFFCIATRRIRVPALPLWIALGGTTYPLYLIHNHWGKAIIDTQTTPAGTLIATFGTIPVLIGSAYLIYRYAEQPLMKFFKRSLYRFWEHLSKFNPSKLA